MKFASLLGLSLFLSAACVGPDAPRAPASHEGASVTATASADPALAARVDRVLDAALEERRIVGGVVLVLKDGAVVYRRAAGLADREANRPMREDTLFRYASLTKTIVSATALALVDRGKLGLEDPVTRYLPDFKPRLATGEAPVITVRHLLTHTSGLGYGFLEPEDGAYHRAGISDALDAPGLSFEENARKLQSVPLLAAPGSAFHYSLSTDVLGEVVARASSLSLPEAVATFVTRPLGMSDTSFAVPPVDRLAAAYADGKPEPVRMADGQRVPLFGSAARFAPSRALDPRSYPSGGAGMIGTAADFAKLLEALRTQDARLLKPETTTTMLANQIGDLRAPELGGDGWGFGFGGAVLVDPAAAKSPMSAGTFRWGGAYGASWFLDRRAGITVVLLTNTAFEGMIGKVVNDLVPAVYGP